ncbi:hypothetical protein LSAT2_016638 [Lamellibrachia satsuma]|nr:hypothetical protein LSAT2_016638 [Lamellibrachia satsuma]
MADTANGFGVKTPLSDTCDTSDDDTSVTARQETERKNALAALAVTWIWGRRCPLAERVYTRDQRATMEKVSFLIFPFLLSQFREQ